MIARSLLMHHWVCAEKLVVPSKEELYMYCPVSELKTKFHFYVEQ